MGDVGLGDEVGVGVGAGETVNGKPEVCTSVTPPAEFTLKVSDNVTGEESQEPENEVCGLTHYRPQFRKRAVTMTARRGTPTATTETAKPGDGEETRFCDMLWSSLPGEVKFSGGLGARLGNRAPPFFCVENAGPRPRRRQESHEER